MSAVIAMVSKMARKLQKDIAAMTTTVETTVVGAGIIAGRRHIAKVIVTDSVTDTTEIVAAETATMDEFSACLFRSELGRLISL